MNEIRVKGKKLTINDCIINFDHNIKQVIEINNIIIVMIDPDSCIRKYGQKSNIYGFSCAGEKIWTCALPTTDTGDRYYKMKVLQNKLTAYSVASFDCIIDPKTGKIISKTFTK